MDRQIRFKYATPTICESGRASLNFEMRAIDEIENIWTLSVVVSYSSNFRRLQRDSNLCDDSPTVKRNYFPFPCGFFKRTFKGGLIVNISDYLE